MSNPPFLALPDAARACRLRTARGEFAVHEAGDGVAGTAVLVPGFTGSKEDFVGLLEPLASAGFRVLAVDGRGQYETEGPRNEEAYAQRELARDVLALAEAVRSDARGRLHLLGHSLGGLVARAAVLCDATPFASLTLLSSGPGAVSAVQQRRLKLLSDALPSMTMEQVWQSMRELDPAEAADERTPPAVAEFLHRRWLANVPEQLAATARQLREEPDRVAELAEVRLPLHVLSGEVDYAWPVPLLDEMAVRLRATRTVVNGAGHSPNAERPQHTARALADFWREAGASGATAS
jgi:pimeloyl-ACP methyl ester carboxylesterase